MTTCRDCDQEMTTADDCTVTELTCGGVRYPTFPYGRDPGWRATEPRCGDCGARRGHHHHIGCDIQCCPRCRGQLISCGCRFDELADEYVDEHVDVLDDEDEAWGATDAGVVDLAAFRDRPNRDAPAPVRTLLPMGEAAAPSRERHRILLRMIVEEALRRGRPCDPDVAVACLDTLEPHIGPAATPLTRPVVNDLLFTHLRNWDSRRSTLLPEGWVGDLWTVLTALADRRLLAPGSDPIRVLLEPLACTAGVGLDGEVLADGEDVDFACQCYVDHDPTLPDGLGRIIVGRRGDDLRALLAVARLQPRGAGVDPADWLPWLALTSRLDARVDRHRPARLAPRFMGMVPADRHNPALWLYNPADGGSGHLLALDHDGAPHFVKSDGRFRLGYRWVPAATDDAALHVAGFHGSGDPDPDR